MLRKAAGPFTDSRLKGLPRRRHLLTGLATILIVAAFSSALLQWRAGRATDSPYGAAPAVRPGGVKTQERPYLGITYVPITTQLATSHGLAADSGILITAVAAASPAQKAGIQPADIMTEFAGQRLTENTTILEILNQHAAGHAVMVCVLRKGEQRQVEVTLGVQ